MTARVPRQRRAEDRRSSLVAAAARLAAAQGPAACTARAVATEAGLPLASVSYYFADLSDLVGEAVRQVCDHWRRHAVRVADSVAADGSSELHRDRLAVVVAAAILPPGIPGTASSGADTPGTDASGADTSGGDTSRGAGVSSNVALPDRAAVVTRYRHLLVAADSPVVTEEMVSLRADLVTVVTGLLPSHDPDVADLLVTVVDGAALGAIAEGDPDPAQRIVAAVVATLTRLG